MSSRGLRAVWEGWGRVWKHAVGGAQRGTESSWDPYWQEGREFAHVEHLVCTEENTYLIGTCYIQEKDCAVRRWCQARGGNVHLGCINCTWEGIMHSEPLPHKVREHAFMRHQLYMGKRNMHVARPYM